MVWISEFSYSLRFLGLDLPSLLVEIIVECFAGLDNLLKFLPMQLKLGLDVVIFVPCSRFLGTTKSKPLLATNPWKRIDLRLTNLFFGGFKVFPQCHNLFLLFNLLDLKLGELGVLFSIGRVYGSSTGFVLGLQLSLFLGHIQQPLVLLFQLGFKIVHILHLGVPGGPHAIDERFYVGDASSRFTNVGSQRLYFFTL